MFSRLFLVAGFALSACVPEPTSQSEDDVALLRESLPGINQKCVDIFQQVGVDALPQDVRECFPMEESKQWSGLWLDEFEGSRFCAAPASNCSTGTAGERVWLSFAPEIQAERPDPHATNALYRIDFVGRKTKTNGAFGHEGGSDNEIVVEELIRFEQVPNG